MPEQDANNMQDHRPAILKEIDSFNDAPGFGMMGILAKEQGEGQAPESLSPSPREQASSPDWEDAIAKGYAPLNTSIQEVNRKYDSRMSGIEQQNQMLMNQNQQIMQLLQQQSQRQEQAYREQIDPDTPISYGYLQQSLQPISQMQQEQQEIKRALHAQALRNEYTHALTELERFRIANPNVPVNKEQVDRVFTDYVRGDYSKAAAIDWRQHFDQKAATHSMGEMETLRAENAKLKQQLEGRPAQTPANKVPPEQRLSPATKPGQRTEQAIHSPVQQGDSVTDITSWKSFRQKGRFKPFGKELGKRLGVL